VKRDMSQMKMRMAPIVDVYRQRKSGERDEIALSIRVCLSSLALAHNLPWTLLAVGVRTFMARHGAGRSFHGHHDGGPEGGGEESEGAQSLRDNPGLANQRGIKWHGKICLNLKRAMFSS